MEEKVGPNDRPSDFQSERVSTSEAVRRESHESRKMEEGKDMVDRQNCQLAMLYHLCQMKFLTIWPTIVYLRCITL